MTPAPLAPPDLEVRGFDYMPLLGARLFGSEFYSLALKNPRGGWAAQKLWWEAFQQKPAGSLPSNEFALCRMADFGTDARAWSRARDVAMHGFILCSDGRYYHPVVVEIAMKASQVRSKARDKKAAQRAAAAAASAAATASADDADRRAASSERHDDAARRDHDVNMVEGLADQPIDKVGNGLDCPQGRPGSVPAEGKGREGKYREGLRPSPGGGRKKRPKQAGLALGDDAKPEDPPADRAKADLFAQGLPLINAMEGGDNGSFIGKLLGKHPDGAARILALIREAHRRFATPGEALDNAKAWIVSVLSEQARDATEPLPEHVNDWPVLDVARYSRHKADVPDDHWPGLERVVVRLLKAGANPDHDIYPVMEGFRRQDPQHIGLGLVYSAVKQAMADAAAVRMRAA